MKILITGSNGVIGKFLKSNLSGSSVIGINRSLVDLTNRAHVHHFFDYHGDFDIILHCAINGGSRLEKDNWKVLDDNVKMYYNLLECLSAKTKFISFGSGSEDHFSNTPYGLSKKVIAKSILNRENSYNIRLYGLFGEGEEDTRFIKSNLKRYANKENIQVYESKYMDFFYIEDLLKVVKYYILNDDLPKEVDCCYDNTKKSLYHIASIINKLDKHKVDIETDYVTPLNGPVFYTGDSKTLESLRLNLVGFENGIKLEYEKYKLRN